MVVLRSGSCAGASIAPDTGAQSVHLDLGQTSLREARRFTLPPPHLFQKNQCVMQKFVVSYKRNNFKHKSNN
jgi:hypothetical protein